MGQIVIRFEDHARPVFHLLLDGRVGPDLVVRCEELSRVFMIVLLVVDAYQRLHYGRHRQGCSGVLNLQLISLVLWTLVSYLVLAQR